MSGQLTTLAWSISQWVFVRRPTNELHRPGYDYLWTVHQMATLGVDLVLVLVLHASLPATLIGWLVLFHIFRLSHFNCR